jgi:hypothetical protein
MNSFLSYSIDAMIILKKSIDVICGTPAVVVISKAFLLEYAAAMRHIYFLIAFIYFLVQTCTESPWRSLAMPSVLESLSG